jgi:transposase-like protein
VARIAQSYALNANQLFLWRRLYREGHLGNDAAKKLLPVTSERAALPDLDTLNHEALKALIVAQHAQILSKDEQLLHKEEQLASREEEIERLKLLIAKLRRMQFGCKSEKLDQQIEQLELRLDELQASRAEKIASTSATPMAAPVVNQTAKRARQPLPAHLPRETRKVLSKQEACPDCGGKLKQLGEDVSETLEYVPEHFKVIRQVRPKLTCAGCEKIVQAEAASRPIARGRGQDFWPTCWSRNTVTTCRCIGSQRSMRAKE